LRGRIRKRKDKKRKNKRIRRGRIRSWGGVTTDGPPSPALDVDA
jgi:hypothetical protein